LSASPVLAADLGGTQLRVALVRDGKVLRRLAEPIEVRGGPEAILKQMSQQFARARGSADLGAPAALGVCMPGPLDTEAGVVSDVPTLPGWDGFPFLARLRDQFALPVALENDAIAAAVGEWRYGAGRGLRHMIYATVSTGIGGGAVVDGRPLHGRRGMASHFGHMAIAQDGPRCSCGRIGCFEAFASGSALGLRAQGLANDGRGYLAALAATRAVRGSDVVDGARAGDAQCKRLIEDEARFLGLGFVSLIHVHSPELVVMGGGVSQAFDLLSAGIHQVIAREAMPAFRDVRVVPAELGGDVGLIGAAAVALLQMEEGGR
jgi:glucokinase